MTYKYKKEHAATIQRLIDAEVQKSRDGDVEATELLKSLGIEETKEQKIQRIIQKLKDYDYEFTSVNDDSRVLCNLVEEVQDL